MKDNKENLNGALNDDAMEEVAGGKGDDKWTPERKQKFIQCMKTKGKSYSQAMSLIEEYSPKGILELSKAESGKVPAALKTALSL